MESLECTNSEGKQEQATRLLENGFIAMQERRWREAEEHLLTAGTLFGQANDEYHTMKSLIYIFHLYDIIPNKSAAPMVLSFLKNPDIRVCYEKYKDEFMV
ncbi:MAG: hypothetical protein AAF518_05805 [Spirochaetota bacterium]